MEEQALLKFQAAIKSRFSRRRRTHARRHSTGAKSRFNAGCASRAATQPQTLGARYGFSP